MAANQSQNEATGAETRLTDATSVRDYLQARINPAVVASLEARLRLTWPAPTLAEPRQAPLNLDLSIEPSFVLNFELKQGQLTWLDAKAHAHATFWFRDAQDVAHLLSNSETAYVDFMQRFMAAELSSDGYLPWAFTLLGLFRGGPNMTLPS